MTDVKPASGLQVADEDFDRVVQSSGVYAKRPGTVYAEFRDESGGADAKHWRVEAATGSLIVSTADDENETTSEAYKMTRSGNAVTQHEIKVSGTAVATFTAAGTAVTTLSTSGNTTLGDAVGDSLTINAGALTAPNIPSVLAYVGSTILNVTGDSTAYTVIFGSEITDNRGAFNTGTGTWTCPNTGKYAVSIWMILAGVVAGHAVGSLKTVTSNRSYQLTQPSPEAVVDANGQVGISWSGVIDMDASDTLSVQVTVTGGTKVVDILGSSDPIYSAISIQQVA